MCGIAGILGTNEIDVREATTASTAALAHRGPDDCGVELVQFGNAVLGFGHRRLSILDLSRLGHQPMSHHPTGCRIVFNGEVYNFRRLRKELALEGETFRSGSDTEVLLAGLARHGQGFVKRLEGMFAFGFYDPRDHTLLLGRDPAGIKPLYLAETRTSVVFASEIRAILASGLVERTIDRRGVAGFLAYGAVQHPFTMYAGITSLTPGTTLSIAANPAAGWQSAHAPQSFWSLPATQPETREADAVSSLRATLNAAVRDHLIADVPVGLFLSAGIDSTILAGLASKHSTTLKSFTVSSEGDVLASETQAAAETARMCGLEHFDIRLSMSTAEATVERWLGAVDEPSIDGLNIYAISQAVRDRGIKVALSGLGADELFGGYPSFREVTRLRSLTRVMRCWPDGVRSMMARIATIGQSGTVLEKLKDIFGSDGSRRSIYLHRRRAMSNTQLKNLGIASEELGLCPNLLSINSTWDTDDNETDAVRHISQLEFRCYQGNMLLRDSDANGMAHGLEIRVPYLDQRILGLAHSMPGYIRLPKRAKGKYLLRQAFKDLLRPEIVNPRKQGFTLPINRWMVGSLRPLCEASLATLKASGLVRPQGVEEVWTTFLKAPNSQVSSRALALVVLGDFVQRHSAPCQRANHVVSGKVSEPAQTAGA